MTGSMTRGWPKATLPLAAAGLAAAPWVHSSFGPAVTLIWLQLPAYLIHQYEEHGKGRFKQYANRLYGNGREVLSDEAIFLINTAGVWGLDLAAFLAAVTMGPGAGLAAVYLSVLNALSHVGATVRMGGGYNPGLWTSLVVFIPLGVHTLAEAVRRGWATPAEHVCGLTLAVGIHAAIVAHVIRKRRSAGSSA
ncbi:MAG: HXXEE domain-containing protein [Bryobacteraceae bacterium]